MRGRGSKVLCLYVTTPVIVTTPYPWLHLLKNQTWSFLKRRRDRPEKYFYEIFYFSTKISTCSPPHWSLRASSVAYFFTYSATFFLYSSGLRRVYFSTASSRKYHDSPVKIHCCCISIERICGVGVGQKLGQERLEYIGEIIERCPGLIDDIQTYSSWHLVNVRMIHLRNNKQSQDLSFQ